jgi:hypothetical protein
MNILFLLLAVALLLKMILTMVHYTLQTSVNTVMNAYASTWLACETSVPQQQQTPPMEQQPPSTDTVLTWPACETNVSVEEDDDESHITLVNRTWQTQYGNPPETERQPKLRFNNRVMFSHQKKSWKQAQIHIDCWEEIDEASDAAYESRDFEQALYGRYWAELTPEELADYEAEVNKFLKDYQAPRRSPRLAAKAKGKPQAKGKGKPVALPSRRSRRLQGLDP